jgi:hypothetical protein
MFLVAALAIANNYAAAVSHKQEREVGINDGIRSLLRTRIVNGEPASQSYPFYAFFEAGCGASIVAPDMVLTAAQ